MYDFLSIYRCRYVALYCTVFEIFDIEEYRDPEIQLEYNSRVQPCEFMHDLYIAEIYRPGTIFLTLIIWV